MNATIAYFTNRRNSRFQWFADSLVRQLSAADLAGLQIVVVDARLWNADSQGQNDTSVSLIGNNGTRMKELADIVAGRFQYLHVPPKPSVWQGPWRQAAVESFAASNARNTALIVAEKPYLLCVDDLSVLAPGWADNARHAVNHGYVVCGAYQKLRDMEVKNGELVMCDHGYRGGLDTRWDKGSAGGIVPWSGSGLFGCSFGVPVDLAVKVDGFDSFCDGQGAEDYDFGIRLERAGGKFYYNRNMLTFEDEAAHFEDQPLHRSSKQVPHDRLPECLKSSHPDGLMSDHVMLQALLQEPGRFLPLGTNNIAELRAQFRRDGTVPTPIGAAIDWRDGTPLRTEAPKDSVLTATIKTEDPKAVADALTATFAAAAEATERDGHGAALVTPPPEPAAEPQGTPEYEPDHVSATFRPEVITPATREKMDAVRKKAAAKKPTAKAKAKAESKGEDTVEL